jgi:hypothetical protein
MNIGSGNGYPESALSNFAPHPFLFRGLVCNSMEGFLQGLKFKNPEMQKHVFTLVGRMAKFKGKGKNWQRDGLWLQGVKVDRFGDEYQVLLDEAYGCLVKNTAFRNALLCSNDAVFEHSIGKSKPSDTVLTRSEFCGRLMRLREEMKNGRK